MKESEIQALISLLDDDDPNVESHVRQTLLNLGDDIIPRLETAWEAASDNLVQDRIEDIIHSIQSRGTIEGLSNWKKQGADSLLRAWYLVSQYQYPELKFNTAKNHINRLVNRAWLKMRGDINVPEKLLILKRLLFEEEKYKANKNDVYNPGNYFVNTLVETKKGSPISLSLLYLIICEELEIPIKGIVLPGYFVLVYQDGGNEFFVDVFNKGAFFVRKDLTRFLNEMKVSDKEKYYHPSTNTAIIYELVQNIITAYQKKRKTDKVKEWKRLLNGMD